MTAPFSRLPDSAYASPSHHAIAAPLRTSSVASRHGERVQTTYLKFGLDISQSLVRVTTPTGRLIGEERTLSGARRLIKGYRKSTDDKTAGTSREGAPTVSTRGA